MRIKLNCVACGHVQELSGAYESYTGQIRCWGCNTRLDVSLLDGKLLSMQLHDEKLDRVLVPLPPPEPAVEVLLISEKGKPGKAR